MFVWAGNAGKLVVNERGIVKDANQVRITPKYDMDGYKYVEYGHTRYYVHELVIQNHGKPPSQNRMPKGDEVVKFIDGNKENCHIDNLEYAKKGKANFKREEGVPEAVEEYVWELLKQGKTYEKIQEAVAQSNYEHRTISIGKIAEVRKKRTESEKDMDGLTPSERASLEAIKKELGETDDREAKKQILAKKANKKNADKAKAKKAKADTETSKKEEEEPKQEEKVNTPHYDKEYVGGGYYKIERDGTDVTEGLGKDPIRFRKKEANELLEALIEDEEKGNKMVKEAYDARSTT